MKNIEHLVKKSHRFGVKHVFMSGIVHKKGFAWQILNDVHD